MRARTRLLTVAPAAVMAGLMAFGLTGCSVLGDGLPFAKGTGSDSYQVQVQMADVSNLVPNAEVKVNDVTVGSVTKIGMKNWRAVLTLRLQDSAVLPANAIANVGQKSLLGAQYLELAAPTGVQPVGRLQAGATIPLERTGTYPSTEDLLIVVSNFLNGSGLTQIKTITTEVNRALGGRTDDVRSLLSRLQQTAGTLKQQRRTIATLIDQTDALTTDLNKQRPALERSLPTLGPGLEALREQRPELVRALRTVDQLDTVAGPILAANRAGLVKDVGDLRAPLKALADTQRTSIPNALNFLATILFPTDKVNTFFHGDYMNLFVELDGRPKIIRETILAPPTVATGQPSPPDLGRLLAPASAGGAAR